MLQQVLYEVKLTVISLWLHIYFHPLHAMDEWRKLTIRIFKQYVCQPFPCCVLVLLLATPRLGQLATPSATERRLEAKTR
jgi:hypothetical protein